MKTIDVVEATEYVLNTLKEKHLKDMKYRSEKKEETIAGARGNWESRLKEVQNTSADYYDDDYGTENTSDRPTGKERRIKRLQNLLSDDMALVRVREEYDAETKKMQESQEKKNNVITSALQECNNHKSGVVMLHCMRNAVIKHDRTKITNQFIDIMKLATGKAWAWYIDR